MVESVVMLNPSVLKVHPRNEEFFDSIEGEDFNRLVESIKLHGVLTPLRATKDMTLISGHQRKRAAIEAGVTEVPVIIDDSTDDDEVLMKLIETNFGRMKNDAIKQAKWLEEYMRLRGIQVGSGRPKKDAQCAELSLNDIAEELGVSVRTLHNLKSLLTLDPAIQQLISDGTIKASTGWTILAKLTPEEQRKLIDKLPDDVKLSAPTVKAKIEEMREELVGNTNAVQQKNSELMGKIDKLTREKNELLSGNLPANESAQLKIKELEQGKRDLYEKMRAKERLVENMQEQLDKASQALRAAEAKATGGDAYTIQLEGEIAQLKEEMKAIERERNDFEYQLNEKDEEILKLRQDKDNGFLRKAVDIGISDKEYNERALDHYKDKIVQTITSFQSFVNEILKDADMIYSLNDAEINALKGLTISGLQSAQGLCDIFVAEMNNRKNNSDSENYPEIWTEDDMIVTGTNNVA